MPKELQEGDTAPDFTITTDEGSLSSVALRGHPFVLYFYPRDDTPGCTREAIAFSEYDEKFSGLKVRVIGVSKDSVASHRKFRAKYGLKITLGSDPDIRLAENYDVWMQKKLYGRSYMGMDRATFLVDGDGVIQKIWRKVKVAGHVEAVFEAARAL